MTYGCQQYDINRLCRYDRSAIDRKCDGCQRTTDSEYLQSTGLWVVGVSHHDTYKTAKESQFPKESMRANIRA